jgi:predicted lipoprotein
MRALPSLILFAFVLASCGDDSGPDPNDAARRAFLVSYADAFYIPAVEELVTRAEALEAATESYAGSLDSADRTAAQEAWQAAMGPTERLELAEVGPAGITFGAAGGVLGGEERWIEIYSWPMNNPCRVDQETVGESYGSADTLASVDRIARGLDAIEYLLFNEDTANRCSSISAINAEGTWDALLSEIPQRRATYAHSAASVVARQARDLRDRWTTGTPTFREQFVTAGEGSAIYPTRMQAVSEAYGALLYVDTMMKDMKVGEPAGIVTCTDATCPDARESLFANVSIDHLERNLDAIAAVFRGPADGTGFDDLMIAVGAADLAGRIDAAIVACQDEAAALEGTIPDLLSADPVALMPLYDALVHLVNLLKTEGVAALDINLSSVPMDND